MFNLNKKKIISIIISGMVLVSSIPFNAYAAATDGGTNVTTTSSITTGTNQAVGNGLINYVPFQNVRINDNFWSSRIKTNIMISIPHGIEEVTKTTVPNFIEAGKEVKGEAHGEVIGLADFGKGSGMVFQDSDLYKMIEAMSNAIAMDPQGDAEIIAKQAEFKDKLNEWVPLVEAAQENDGYLDTLYSAGYSDNQGNKYTINDRFTNFWNHELYCMGHFMECAVANYRATGDTRLYNVAVKLADCLDNTFGPAPKRVEVPGHPEVEKALVKLSQLTDELKGKGQGDRYWKLAKFFLDERGHDFDLRTSGYNGGEYSEDDVPVDQLTKGADGGHAVRAAFLYTGMADVAQINGDSKYLDALNKVWDNITNAKMYITGGIGNTGSGEALGADYDHPNQTSYLETCASLANGQFNKEMNSIYGDGKYVDVLERTLYNGTLVGVNLNGDEFTYSNPLQTSASSKRSSWFSCACCPPNLMRTIASIGGNIYAQKDDNVYVNLYISSETNIDINGQQVKLSQKSNYPWDGNITVNVDPTTTIGGAFSVKLRIPGWETSGNYTVQVNGQDVDKTLDKGYVTINREWKSGDKITLNLPMDIQRVKADPRVAADVGRVALQRGPLVYCLEGAENNNIDVNSYVIKPEVNLTTEYKPDLLNGVTVIKGTAEAGKPNEYTATDFTAIPYYAWNNVKDGGTSMVVWARDTEPAYVAPTIASKSKVSTSYCSSWEHLDAINNQTDPANSADRSNNVYGNWPEHGIQWVQYDFDKAYTINSSDVYWFVDGQGIWLPSKWDLKYWDDATSTWKDVQSINQYQQLQYGIEADKYNTCQFAPVTTTKLRLEVWSGTDTNGTDQSTGIIQWKVNGTDPSQETNQLASVTVTADNSYLAVNGTAKISVAGKMSDNTAADLKTATVEYSSDNAAVATVDKNTGVVTALSEGTATITAKVTLGDVTVNGTVEINVGSGNVSNDDFVVNSTFNLTNLQPGKMLNAKTSVTNNKSFDKSVLAIVGLYDENDKMVNVSFISKVIPVGTTENLDAGFKLPSDTTNYKVKVFVWDGTDLASSTMQPISNMITLP